MYDFRVPSPYMLRMSNSECRQILQCEVDPLLSRDTALIYSCDEEFSELKALYQSHIQTNEVPSSDKKEFTPPSLNKEEDGEGEGSNPRVFQMTPLTGQLGHRICEPSIVRWLNEHFEKKSDCSVARSEMYHSYVQFCRQSGRIECNQALFGKTVRAVFPKLSTRRIGVRGQSKYHYYGLRPKPTSPFFSVMNHTHKRSSHFVSASGYTMQQAQNVTNRPDQKTGDLPDILTALIPDFPTVNSVQVSKEILDNTATFLMLYRMFAVDFLTAFGKMDLAQVAAVVSNFWRDLPSELRRLVTLTEVQRIILLCDHLVYRAVSDLLQPSILQQPTESTIQVIRTAFVEVFPPLMAEALHFCPAGLKDNKLREVQRLTSAILRGLDLSRQMSDLQEIFKDTSKLQALERDWPRLNLAHIITKSAVVCECDSQVLAERIQAGFTEFYNMIREHNPVESYLTWLESFFNRTMQEDIEKYGIPVQAAARKAVLHFSYITETVSRELTSLDCAGAFGCFHRFEMAMRDYMIQTLEKNIPHLCLYNDINL